ncbi:MAG: sensor histidine kinase [Leptospira sp.]|nr:sensor histidine kinase [Leptospira sp.]
MKKWLILTFIFTGIWGRLESSPIPRFNQSEIDLRNWNFDKPFSLEGEIDFYWQQFIHPNKISPEGKSNLIKIGSSWNQAYNNSNDKLPSHGYGTYNFQILLNTSESYSLYIPTVSTAYKLFINGEYKAGVGKVGVDSENSVAFLYPQTIHLPQVEKLEILIQVSNFQHVNGGLWKNLRIGKQEQINRFRENGLALDFFIFGSFFIMAIYHFGLYILHKKDKSTVYFGLFLFILSFRSLVTGEHFLYKALGMDYFSMDWGLRIEFSAFYLGIPITLAYLYSIFPRQTNKIFATSLAGIFFITGLLVFILPSSIFTHFTYYIEYLIIIVGIFGIIIISNATIKKEEGSYLALFGFLVFFIFVLNDILYTRNFIDTGYYAHVGFYLFVLIQSLFISRRFAKAFHRVEELSSNLEKLVEVRTQEYKIQKQKAEDAGLWKDNLISLVAHDLRSPLSSFYNALELLEDEEFEPEDKKQVIKSSRNMIHQSLSTITHLLNLNRFQNGKFSLSKEKVNLQEFIHSIVESMKQEIDEKSQAVALNLPDSIHAFFDPYLIKEVIRNILLNAMKYSPKNSQIFILVKANDGKLQISISDEGMGMTDEQVGDLLSGKRQESKLGTSGERGFGIGMSICKQLITAHGGSLDVASSLGKGTTISLMGLEIFKS